jgi:hypothetical protein
MPSLTITFTAQQAARIQTAFASRFGIPTPGMDDLKAWVVKQVKGVVLDEERDAAIRAVQQSHTDAPFDPT